ncbi:MAG: YceK/YidQ family lipoprotein, partial [Pseudomonadota bacterium]
KTLCETTSRAYGGVSYNFCKLHSARSSVNFDFVLAFYLLDTGVSALTDTAFLPFTVYQQSEMGSIEIGGADS